MNKPNEPPKSPGFECKRCADRAYCLTAPTAWALTQRESQWTLLRILRCKTSRTS